MVAYLSDTLQMRPRYMQLRHMRSSTFVWIPRDGMITIRSHSLRMVRNLLNLGEEPACAQWLRDTLDWWDM